MPFFSLFNKGDMNTLGLAHSRRLFGAALRFTPGMAAWFSASSAAIARCARSSLAIVTLAGFGYAAQAVAAPDKQAVELYRDGAFVQAARRAEQAGSPDDLALAARATIAHARFIADPAHFEDLMNEAERLARAALAANPHHVEANLQLCVALGFLGLSRGPIAAMMAGYPGEARQRWETAIAEDTDNPWGHAIKGAWHFEIVRRAGPAVAERVFDADAKSGARAYRWALTLAPDNPVLRYEFAAMLLRVDANRFAAYALGELERVITTQPPDRLATYVRQRACRLATALAERDRERVKDLVILPKDRYGRENRDHCTDYGAVADAPKTTPPEESR